MLYCKYHTCMCAHVFASNKNYIKMFSWRLENGSTRYLFIMSHLVLLLVNEYLLIPYTWHEYFYRLLFSSVEILSYSLIAPKSITNLLICLLKLFNYQVLHRMCHSLKEFWFLQCHRKIFKSFILENNISLSVSLWLRNRNCIFNFLWVLCSFVRIIKLHWLFFMVWWRSSIYVATCAVLYIYFIRYLI